MARFTLCLLLVCVAATAVYGSYAPVPLVGIPGLLTPQSIAMAEKAALLALMEALNNHPALSKEGGWANVSTMLTYNESRPCVQFWSFISCDNDGRINAIILDNPTLAQRSPNFAVGGNPGPLRGYIPWSKMTALQHLQALDIQGNQISGLPFDSSISKFTGLREINYMGNYFKGAMDPGISALRDMRLFQVAWNRLSGPIPRGVSGWENVTYLDLSQNTLSDSIPVGISALTNLQRLDLGGNSLQGSLPTGWSTLSKLTLLNLQKMNINGSIPASWSNMKSLLHFQINTARLTTTFPSTILQLPNLQDFVAYGNNMYGNLPKDLWKSTALTKLDLSQNFFNGSIVMPDEAQFAEFKFYGNCLTVPASVMMVEQQEQNNVSACTTFYNNLYPKNNTVYAPAPPPNNTPMIIAIVVSVVVCLAVILGSILFLRYTRQGRRISKMFTKGLRQATREFTLKELKTATSNWQTVVGKGGYGTVYKAVLKDGTYVAVKRLDQVSKQGDVEFIREVELLSRVHHRHLVNLIGFCAEKGERALIYEYMAMGSLYEHLHGESAKEYPLSWDSRTKIGIHVALGIEYLHYGADPPLIHRDIKSANILLSDDGYSKVADFGLCKEAPIGAGSDGSEQLVPTATAVRGSFGYLDPEYVNTSILSEKSDVYSYGVVLLELISGHKSIHEWQPLAYWAEEYLADREKAPLMVDPKLEGSFDLDELYALCDIARTCVQDQAVNRPTIRDVAKALIENLGHGTSSWAGSHRDSASVVSSSQEDATSLPSSSYPSGSEAQSSEFSYQNYSETLHWTPNASGEMKTSGSKSGNVAMSMGANGDRLPVPVPRKPDGPEDQA